MRTIKFRGKRSDNGEWVVGDLLHIAGGCLIYFGSDTDTTEPDIEKSSLIAVEFFKDEIAVVAPNSVGQFTGLYDKNGKEIYEGDIILYGGSIQHEVVFRHGAFGYLLYGGEFISYAGNTNFTFNPLNRSKEHEVIGNIYDNPELRQTQYNDTTSIH